MNMDTSVIDKLWIPGDKPYIGRVTLDLNNADTGKLEESVEAENYATDLLIAHLKWTLRRAFNCRVNLSPGTTTAGTLSSPSIYDLGGYNPGYFPQGPNTDTPIYVMANQVVLTSAPNPEDASGDRMIKGTLNAWADVLPYVGTDILRGSGSTLEGNVTPALTKFVFDWGTNAGNGTIRSVYWTSGAWNGNPAAFEILENGYPTVGVSHQTWPDLYTGLVSANNGYPRGLILDEDGVTYWSVGRPQGLVRRSLGTGAIVSSFDLGSANPTLEGLAYDGTNFWVLSYTGVIRKYNKSGVYQNVQFTSASGWASSSSPFCAALAYGNGRLWLLDSNSGGKVYEIDPANGTIIQSWSSTSMYLNAWNSPRCAGMMYVPDDGYNGAEIWISQVYSLVSVYTTSGVLKRRFGPGRVGISSTPYGVSLAMDPASGGYYFGVVSASSNSQIYRINGMRQFLARSLLPADVVKSNTQTMKLTYQFDYT